MKIMVCTAFALLLALQAQVAMAWSCQNMRPGCEDSSSPVQMEKVYSCQGTDAGGSYTLDIYQGYGYDAQLALGGSQITQIIPAEGNAYTECGSRTIPCHMIQIAQYSTHTPQEPELNFTMISGADASTGSASLTFYENNFSQEKQTVKLTCQKY